MVLDSQAPRSGMSRRYMVSRRRPSRRWPWFIFALVGVGAAVLYVIFSGGSNAQDTHADPGETVLTANDTASAQPRREGPRSVEQMAGPVVLGEQRRTAPAPGSAPAQAEVPTLTLNGRRSQPAAPAPTRQANATPVSRPAAPSPAASTTAARTAIPTSTGPVAAELAKGMNLIADRRFVEGRRLLSRLLYADDVRLSAVDAQMIRDTLTSVNRELVFSPNVTAGDPVAEQYTVQSGDLLARIAPRVKLTYQFLERINGIEARRLQVGQKIKLIRGPFHARIDKSEYRMDIVLLGPDGGPLYVRSFPIGIGEGDSTPAGRWVIEPGRKVTNPAWRNPRTGEFYKPDDPANPIGEYWLALEGADAQTADLNGYGIHGTVEPESIGQQASMGCVRMRDADIELVYEMLVEGESTVQIMP